MTLQVLLLVLLLVLVLVGAVAFQVGESKRRGAGGGPRPVASVGEALRQVAGLPAGRVLVLIAGEELVLAPHPPLLEALAEPGLRHVLLRRGGDEEQVAAHLFQKYAGQPLPPGAWALLLDREGLPIARADLQRGPLETWLPGWLADQPTLGARRPEPGPGGVDRRDDPVARG